MVSEPMWSYRQERILGLEISQDGNGLPFRSVQYPVSRGMQTHTCFGFSFSSHSQNVDFKTKE